ncbi:ABC transporter substrate-binding protein [Paenibacillus xylaniclasticus]|uniref:ABC transporter substrate-binding protein n=1 Tax=Paenibacillus xylaniclasticus TaxID=588083 RepID=UPI000FD97D09|nr:MULTISPECIES: extracellular solute-binding protein [Paenibacillus]GFN34086.1 sugar ABC transporter substrate-binding protein [Paenibacillus curdlanolyticus]
MTTIRLMTEISYNMGELLAAKASFEQANPGVHIVVEQVNDYFEIMRALQSDEAPDIIETGGLQIGNPDGVFRDLNGYVTETSGLEEDLYMGLIRAARHGGVLPSLPIEISAPLIIYDKEKFDRAGLAYPTDDWTWADMIALAKQLTLRDEHGVASQFGLGIGIDIEWFEPFIMRNGGRYVAPDGSTTRGFVDSAATIEAFQLIVDAFRKHRVVRMPDEPCSADVWYEECAMKFSFMWNANDFLREQPVERYGVVGLPHMPGGQRANMVYMGGIGITAASAHPDLAWSFMRHYLLECHSWMPPISRSQAEQRGLTKHPIWSRYLQELDDVQLSGFFLNKKWNASRQLINEDIYRMIVDGADVSRTLQSWTRYA